MFIIWGQNGIIASFIILSYCSVWLLHIGRKKNIVAKIFVLITKNIFFIFFVKL